MRRNLFFSLISSAIACLALANVSQAGVPRAFVSINGSDLNACSAVQPCRSFNQALTVVQPGGEIVVQNSGGYSTGFTINQSVTIDAAGSNASVISINATDLCTINTGPSDRVVLRGISFHGASTGSTAIDITQVGSLYVEHCSITDFSFPGTGILMPNGGNLFVTDTDVRNSIDGMVVGTLGANPASIVVEDSRFSGFGNVGVQLFNHGTGAVTVWISNCTSSLYNGPGFDISCDAAGNLDVTLVNCRAVGNGVGLSAGNTSTGTTIVRIANCVVTGNGHGIKTGGAATLVLGTNPGTNFISGNTTDGSTTGSVTLARSVDRPNIRDRFPSSSLPDLPAGEFATDEHRPEPIAFRSDKHGPQRRRREHEQTKCVL